MAVKVIVDVPEVRIVSAICKAPFDKAKRALERKGYEIISLGGEQGNAALRMQEGADSPVSRNGNWVREAFLCVPGEQPRLVRNSPVMENPVKATNSHRDGQEFYPFRKQVERALEDSVEIPYGIGITTDRFGEDERAVWIFGEQAEPYGEFLREARIKEMPIYLCEEAYVNSQERPFVRPAWFGSLDNRSSLGGYLRHLSYGYWLRGVFLGESS